MSEGSAGQSIGAIWMETEPWALKIEVPRIQLQSVKASPNTILGYDL